MCTSLLDHDFHTYMSSRIQYLQTVNERLGELSFLSVSGMGITRLERGQARAVDAVEEGL